MGQAAPTQDWQGVELEYVFGDPGGVEIFVRTVGGSSRCPVCGRVSARMHSRYARTVADLPWHGASVRLRVQSRRFFCSEPSCERRIFCERLPWVAAHARKTDRLEEALLTIVLELGGRAGAKLAEELGFVVGRDALLRRAKSAPLPDGGEVKILGFDDCHGRVSKWWMSQKEISLRSCAHSGCQSRTTPYLAVARSQSMALYRDPATSTWWRAGLRGRRPKTWARCTWRRAGTWWFDCRMEPSRSSVAG